MNASWSFILFYLKYELCFQLQVISGSPLAVVAAVQKAQQQHVAATLTSAGAPVAVNIDIQGEQWFLCTNFEDEWVLWPENILDF